MKDSTRDKLKLIFSGKAVTPTDRIWALSVAGFTQKDIADMLGIKLPSVNAVIHDIDKSINVATKVAEVTGLSLKCLWPCGRYDVALKDRTQKSHQEKKAA